MARTNWKGSISFGLVNVPIMLYNSIEPQGAVSFKQINRKTGSRIKYKRVDVETEKEVPWEEIGKGYEYEKNAIIPVEEGELKRIAGENARTIAIEAFIDKKNISYVNVEQTYYLVPDKKGEKGYVILREALKDTNKIGIAKVIISTKEYLAAVSTYENALVLYLLHYHDEIRDLDQFNIPHEDFKKYKVNNKEIEIAKKLINAMTGKWKPEKYKDEYKEAVKKWVTSKLRHLPAAHMPSRSVTKAAATGKMINFVDLLKKSLETSKSTKSTAVSSSKKRAIEKTKHLSNRHVTS